MRRKNSKWLAWLVVMMLLLTTLMQGGQILSFASTETSLTPMSNAEFADFKQGLKEYYEVNFGNGQYNDTKEGVTANLDDATNDINWSSDPQLVSYVCVHGQGNDGWNVYFYQDGSMGDTNSAPGEGINDTKFYIAPPKPALTLTKQVSLCQEGPWVDSLPLTQLPATVYYKIVIENTGEVALKDVIVSDPFLDPITGSPIASIPAGMAEELEGSLEITEDLLDDDADGNPYAFTNVASVSVGGYWELHATADAVVCFEPEPSGPAVTITKQVSLCQEGEWADSLTLTELPATVYYKIVVENTGDVDLENVTVSDPLLGLLTASPIPSIPAGTAWEPWIVGLMITEDMLDDDADDNPDVFTNVAMVNVACPELEATADAVVCYDPEEQAEPCISITKMVSTSEEGPWNDSITLTHLPETVYFKIIVENTGDVVLENVTISDPLPGQIEGMSIPSIPVGMAADPLVIEFEITKDLLDEDGDEDDDTFTNIATVNVECPELEGTADAVVCYDPPESSSHRHRSSTGTTVPEEPVPLAPPVIEPVPEPVIIQEMPMEIAPLGAAVLPKTGEMSPALFYGLGSVFTALGLLIRRKF